MDCADSRQGLDGFKVLNTKPSRLLICECLGVVEGENYPPGEGLNALLCEVLRGPA